MSNSAPEKDFRNHLKSFRMNDAEYELFLENTERAQMSNSDFIREKVCKTKATKARRKISLDQKALAAALGQLMKIGSNVNQIAHVLNIAKSQPQVAPATAAILTRNETTITEIHTAIVESCSMISKALSYDTGSEQD